MLGFGMSKQSGAAALMCVLALAEINTQITSCRHARHMKEDRKGVGHSLSLSLSRDWCIDTVIGAQCHRTLVT